MTKPFLHYQNVFAYISCQKIIRWCMLTPKSDACKIIQRWFDWWRVVKLQTYVNMEKSIPPKTSLECQLNFWACLKFGALLLWQILAATTTAHCREVATKIHHPPLVLATRIHHPPLAVATRIHHPPWFQQEYTSQTTIIMFYHFYHPARLWRQLG